MSAFMAFKNKDMPITGGLINNVFDSISIEKIYLQHAQEFTSPSEAKANELNWHVPMPNNVYTWFLWNLE